MMYFVFFFKQKTAYEMRISDWSSDVCSSDLWNMIGYVTLGTDDLARAAAFYDAIAAELETPRMMEYESFIAWGKPDGGAGIGLTKPFDGNAASVGNGAMVALQAMDAEQVQRLYDLALAHGDRKRTRLHSSPQCAS